MHASQELAGDQDDSNVDSDAIIAAAIAEKVAGRNDK